MEAYNTFKNHSSLHFAGVTSPKFPRTSKNKDIASTTVSYIDFGISLQSTDQKWEKLQSKANALKAKSVLEGNADNDPS